MSHDLVLECRGISHGFGPKRVLFEVNLQVIRGEIVSLVGPSGCGKSTLLRAIVGTHPPCRGEVITRADGEDTGHTVNTPGRDRGIVYQNYSLFPFLTARENVALGLMLDQTDLPFRFFQLPRWRDMRKGHLEAATSLLEKLKLGDAAHLYPHEMSGGMRQRVAIAQTLIMKPEIMLLDEPFGALDEATREELQQTLLTLYVENCDAKKRNQPPPCTILIVTHELNEAIYVGDRVVALSQYWDWEKEGFDSCPGATVVYDRLAPVYLPDQERNFEASASQRRDIRHAAFESAVLQPRGEFIDFWTELRAGRGEGVLS